MLGKIFMAVHGRRMADFDGIPGPEPVFPTGNVGEFMTRKRQPWEVLAGYRDTFGPMTLIWMFGTPAIVLNDPDLIGDVLVNNHAAYYKKDPHDALVPIISPNSPFIANQPEWQSMRDNHPMSIEGIGEWLDTRTELLRDAMIERIKNCIAASSVDLTETMQKMTFDIFTLNAFGHPLDDQIYRDFVSMGNAGTRRMQIPMLNRLPVSPMLRATKRRWENSFDQIINDRKSNPDPKANDSLSVWLRRGTNLSNEAFRDTMANVTYGGVYSASSAVISALFLLNQHKDVADRVTEEASRLIADKEFRFSDPEGTNFLDCVLRETMRYYAPVPLYFRNVNRDSPTKLGEFELPADTMVMITNWAVQRSSEHWTNPDRFDPSRWEDGGIEANPIGSPYFFPFGRGPRMCLGMPFAMYFMKLALATILSQAKVEIPSELAYRQSFRFGVMMPIGIQAKFTAR